MHDANEHSMRNAKSPTNQHIKAMSLIAPFWLNEHPQVGRYMCLNSILPLQMPSLSIKPPSEGLVCELGWKMSGGKLNKLGHLGFEGEC